MKKFIVLLFLLLSVKSFGATCTTLSRTNNGANSVLTSSGLNADFNQLITGHNAFDGGCVTDGTLEFSALNTTDFEVLLNTPRLGCEISQSDAATVSVDKCTLAVNGNFVATTVATTVTWGCSGCASEVASTVYYLYAKNGSTGTTLDLLISTTAPSNNGYDASSNRILGRFYNDGSSDISTSMDQWDVSGFDDHALSKVGYIKDVKAAGTDGGTFTAGSWQTRTLNTTSGAFDTFGVLTANQFTLIAGTYSIKIEAPAFDVDQHKSKLRNITTSANDILGRSAHTSSAGNGESTSLAEDTLVLTTSTTFEVQHWSSTTHSTNGFGISDAARGVSEIYTQVRIEKLK